MIPGSEKKEMHLCYAADDNFSMLTGVSMLSVLQSMQKYPVHFFVLDGGISQKNRELLLQIAEQGRAKIDFLDIEDQMARISAAGQKAWGDFPSHVTWARLFLPELLPAEIDRILYLDGDTVVTGDLSELYYTELQGNTIAAVEDCVNAKYKAALGLPEQARYINAGIVLFDLTAWRTSGPKDWMEDLLRTDKVYAMADQDVLNLMFRDRIRFLPLKYNYSTWFRVLDLKGLRCLLEDKMLTSFSEEEVCLCEQERVIVHYNSCGLVVRPWYQGQTDPAGNLWRQMYSQSPWADQSLTTEPARLSRGEQRDRKLYQTVGKKWFPAVHAVDYAVRKNVSRLLKGRK